MIGFYDLVAARLQDPARCPALLQVATGMKPEEAVEMLALGPDVTALVTPLSEEAFPVTGTGFAVTQVEGHLFGVTMALTFPGGFPQFEVARAQIKAALRGWLPAGVAEAVEYRGGAQLQYSAGQDGGRWLYLLRFRVTFQETYEAQP